MRYVPTNGLILAGTCLLVVVVLATVIGWTWDRCQFRLTIRRERPGLLAEAERILEEHR